MKSLLVLIIFALSFDYAGFSQNEAVQNYSTKDGLPSSQVYDIIQDDYGYLWFSTDKGLSRYNGYEFQNYSKSDGLTDNVVFDFLKRPNGEIWCTTNSSTLFYFSGETPKFTAYKFNDLLNKHGSNRILHSLYIAKNEDVYLAFHDHFDFFKLSKSGEIKSNTTRFRHGRRVPDSIFYMNVIKDDTSNPFFFLTVNSKTKQKNGDPNVEITSVILDLEYGARRFEGISFSKQNTSVFMNNTSVYISRDQTKITIENSKEIIASGKLNDHQFWVGYRYGGGIVYDLNGNVINKFLPDRSVTQLFEDHEGHLWISTLEKGVFKIGNQSLKFLDEIGTRNISALSKGPNEALYFGGYDGKVFCRSQKGEVSLIYTPIVYQKPVHICFNEWNNKIYFSSDKIFDLDRAYVDLIHVDYLSLINNRYIANGTIGIRLLDIETSVNSDIFLLIRTKDVIYFNEFIYVASIFGLHRKKLHGKKNSEVAVINGIRIDDLEVLGKRLVLGTNGNGLIILNKKQEREYEITQSDGLSSNYVTKSYAENDSTLWVCTNQGINRIQFNHARKKFKIDKLNASDGLVSNEVWDILIAKDTIWIGTQSGVNYMAKKDFNKLQKKENNYFLKWRSIFVNDERIQNKHSFAYDENKMKFNLLGISFGIDEDLEYQYKLVGLDDNWSFTKSRNITFSSLAPGSYELIVNVRGKNKTWGKNQIRYAFTIHPPFWKTWWFITSCVLGVGAIVYLFFKIRVLTYNKDVVREILRYILQKLRRDEPTLLLRENGKDVKVKTGQIHFVKTSGNYLEIHLADRSHLIRSSISKFMDSLPDTIEFVQVHRSYIVRIDKVQQKGKDELIVLDTPIPVGRVYLEQLKVIDI